MAAISSECKLTKQLLKDQLGQVPDVPITLDIWSDRNCRGFLGVTCHYISNGQLRSGLLACQRMTGTYISFSGCIVRGV
jgi:hypothetical protein